MYPIVSQLCMLAFVAGANGPSAAAYNDAQVWLERMTAAVDKISYEGTYVHIINQSTAETMRIIHKVDKDGRVKERLISLDGEGREIIRNGDEVRCTLKGDKSVVVDRIPRSPVLASLPGYQQGLEELYRFISIGKDRVANRDTRIIEVRPRDEFRYGHKLWLDEETAMPLRSALINNAGEIVEQVLFTSISLGKVISDEELQPSLAADENYRWFVDDESVESTQSATGAGWQAGALPRGFKLTVTRTTENDTSARKVEHYVYTDGLASVSVFVQRNAEDSPPLEGLSRIGAANAYGTTIDGYQVTAVGEVPPSTVEMIGASLKRQQ